MPHAQLIIRCTSTRTNKKKLTANSQKKVELNVVIISDKLVFRSEVTEEGLDLSLRLVICGYLILHHHYQTHLWCHQVLTASQGGRTAKSRVDLISNQKDVSGHLPQSSPGAGGVLSCESTTTGG